MLAGFFSLFICWVTYHFFRVSNTCEKRGCFLLAGYQEETFVGDKK